MEPFTLQWAAERLNGRIIGDDATVTGVCTDTRKIEPGALFFALPGENSDGHRYVRHALGIGAAAAVVSHQIEGVRGPLLVVPDTLQALGDLAMYYRRQFPIPVVGITGSVGKTSTKEMTATALRSRCLTLANEKNYNSEIGVPLTLFRLDKTHEAAVIEMGMRGLGQIDRLAEIAEPTIGVITNIGYAHMELLGSRQNIAQAKAELLARLPANGVAILPHQDEFFEYLRSRVPSDCRIITFGAANSDVALHARRELADGGIEGTFRVDNRMFNFALSVPGAHHGVNAQAAVAVAFSLDVPIDSALDALSRWTGADGRMTIRQTRDRFTVIDDCYNAGPESTTSALETLSTLKTQGGRCVAVLGEMRELGDAAYEAHRLVGIKAAHSGLDVLVTIGPLAEQITLALKEVVALSGGDSRMPTHYQYQDVDSAIAEIEALVSPGDIVLVKGSRALHMEKIVAKLTGELETGGHG
jgi:UDP-N-acetylmuramoyl-tripeptide--D-alanyl-D-alanine ligase